MFEQYPYLRDSESGTSWRDEVYKGWLPLFDSFCDKVNELLDSNNISRKDIIFEQVKEKFGTLRVYGSLKFETNQNLPASVANTVNGELYYLTEMLEYDTEVTCHACGEKAAYKSTGWILPYCAACAQKSYKRKKGQTPFTAFFRELKGE